MKCQYCSSEIPDDSVFCPECGENQTISTKTPPKTPVSEPKPTPETPVCPVCGMPTEYGSLFCSECGTPIPSTKMPGSPKKSKTPVIIGTIIGVILLIAILIAAVLLLSKKENSKTTPVSQEATEPASSSEEELLSDVDFNLLDEDQLLMEGFIKKTASGETVLRWDDEYTFYGKDFDGTKILLEDAQNAYIDESALPDGIIDDIKSNQTVTIDGQLYFDSEKLYITPFAILDETGDDLIEAFEEKQIKESSAKENIKPKTTDSDYILPQSSSRLLTDNDVEGMDIREINYAKNEIYARHGRLFDSAELQNYFNNKSWYHGTVRPEAFSNALLSDIEQKNAEFLSNLEFSIDPSGYKLDVN